MFSKITNRKIRIAVVGCGRISKNHFGSIEKHADNMVDVGWIKQSGSTRNLFILK